MGNAPLHEAVNFGNPSFIWTLLNGGANID